MSPKDSPTVPPVISQALVEFLASTFPDRCPDRDTSLEDIRFRSGQVAVVRFLRDLLTQQEQEDPSANV